MKLYLKLDKIYCHLYNLCKITVGVLLLLLPFTQPALKASNQASNPFFYKQMDVLGKYYEQNKDYTIITKYLDSIEHSEKKLPLCNWNSILAIMLEHNDTNRFWKNVVFLAENFGFDCTESLRFEKEFHKLQKQAVFDHKKNILDSLQEKWKNNHVGIIKINTLIKAFCTKEYEVYQEQSRTDSLFEPNIDTLFNDLLKICSLQGTFPNILDNGCGIDIFIQLSHILSVNLVKLNSRWLSIVPYIEKSFIDGKISNTMYFMYDRFLFELEEKQYYGTFGEQVEYVEPEYYQQRKKKYLIEENQIGIDANQKWLNFYKTEGIRE